LRSQQPAAATNVVLAQLNLAAVPSGNCELLVEVLGKDDRVLAKSSRLFQRSNPGMPVPGATDELSTRATATSADELRGTFVADLDSTKLPHYLISLRPVTTVVEAAFVMSLANTGTSRQQRAYLYHFWKKQGPNDAAERWAEYKRRIEYVDAKFANSTFNAYETDQGRVYLQYGPPDQLFTERSDPQRATANSDGRPYQIWNYYKLKNLAVSSNQTNRTFVFFQRNLGDPSPRLIHSNAKGEAADPNWRSQVGDRFSGNARFDRNAGSGRQ
jgi:GWxTD domain-containing protein